MNEFEGLPVDLRFDPIAHAWASMHPHMALAPELRQCAGVCTTLGPLWPRVYSGRLVDSVLARLVGRTQEAATPPAATDAELGPGKFLGKPCPSGHRVRYEKTRQCVVCLRAAVKRCNDRKKRPT